MPWVLVPLQGADMQGVAAKMSMAVSALEPACWCRFRPLRGAAARCLRQCAIWSTIFGYLGSMSMLR